MRRMSCGHRPQQRLRYLCQIEDHQRLGLLDGEAVRGQPLAQIGRLVVVIQLPLEFQPQALEIGDLLLDHLIGVFRVQARVQDPTAALHAGFGPEADDVGRLFAHAVVEAGVLALFTIVQTNNCSLSIFVPFPSANRDSA